MNLLSLHASFGRLNNETLTFTDGLNLITLPNESGKSTWSQFLLAMFYGIDTSERAKNGILPVKTKYRPWSGAPMQGSMELEWNGRLITIERTSAGRGCMNRFRAFETQSGLDIPELTAENCGRLLLGVERSVFERSAFIRQTGIAVTQDNALEQRLQALVTTADEGASYSEAEKYLRDLKNHLGRPRTGQLSRLQSELAQIQQQSHELEDLGREIYALNQQLQTLTDRELALQQQLRVAQAHEAATRHQQLCAAQALMEQKQTKLHAAQVAAENLPDSATLDMLEHQLDLLPPLPQQPGEAPRKPELPAALRGLNEEQIRQTIQEELSALDAQPEQKKPSVLLPIFAVLLSIIGIALLFALLPLGLGFIVAGQAFLFLTLHQRKITTKENRQAIALQQAVFNYYAVEDRADLIRQSERCCAELALYQQLAQQYAEEVDACQRATDAHETAKKQILLALSLNEQADLSQARSTIRAAKAAHEALRQAKTEAVQAARSFSALQAALGESPVPDTALLQQTPTHTANELSIQLDQLRMQKQALRSRLDQQEGRRGAVGDPALLSARQEQLHDQCATLELHLAALDAAAAALEAAHNEVQTRISPRLTQLAGEYMSFLTDGRYDHIQLTHDFSAYARLSGESIHQSLSYLSTGTVDQLYLSIRLAICALTLNPANGAPLILDDALAFFDDARCARALSLLKQLAHDRQILLFTCQSRESALFHTCTASPPQK